MSSRLQQFCRDQVKAKLKETTLKQLAEDSQVSFHALVRLSSNQRHETTVSVLEKLYRYFTGRELSL